MKPNWFDMLIYRLYVWRWNPILKSNPVYRELFISYMKAFDTLDENDKINVTVTITKLK